MSADRRLLAWVALAAAAILLLDLLSAVLLPFILGAAVAYFLDPAARRLERQGCSRTLATAILSAAFFALAASAALALAPTLQNQVLALAANLPAYLDHGWVLLGRVLDQIETRLTPEDVARLREAAGSYAGDALLWAGRLVRGMWSGGLALVNLLALVFVTPLVTFYLLRDWPRVVTTFDSLLPRREAETIRTILAEMDRALAGFVRGQALVCLTMGAYYAAALTLAGLDFGLLIGVCVGLLTAVPVVGAVAGALLSVGLAAIQFDAWQDVALIAGIFVAGQAVEGNVLSPKLVGDRVGLHPLWIVFALLAGGAIGGLLGVLLAVPAAAAAGVLARHGVGRYLQSELYKGAGRPREGKQE